DGDFTNVTTMSSAFSAIGNNYTTEKLTIDLSSIKTSNKLTGTSRLFAESYYIEKIIFSDKFETSGVTNFAEMFRGCGSLSEIVGVEDFDTTSAIYLNGMFWNNKITSLDLTAWNTSNVTTIEHLFRGCSKLETLNVSNWNVANVTNMSDVFGTPVLNELDLSKWTNSKVTKTGYMFQGGNYTVLDLSGIDTSLVTDMGYMFNETGKIQTVYVSDKFVINTNQAMFINNKAMVGGAGTNYPGGAYMTSYGVVDNPDNDEPGFFTYKNARYIRYHDNDGDDTNDEANYDLMPSHYIATDSNNPYTLATALSENKFERPGYRFLGWATSADGEKLYDDKAAISTSASKDPLELYAVWYKLEATLDTGANINAILKNLAAEPTAFEHYAGTPNFEQIQNEQDIALPSSDVPVYAWYDTESTKIYWWSEAEKPKMNTDSSSFFAGMSSVTSIDVEGLDASNATNMSHMFRGTGLTDIDFSKLESQNVTDMSYMFHGIKITNTLDVSKLDTSSVRNMASMFEGANFTSISFFDTLSPSASKFKTNEVTSMHYMFKDSTRLTSLDLSSFNTSNVKDFAGTFYGATGLKTLNLDGWDTGNATTMYIMFNSASSLTRLDLSHFDTKNVTTMQQMFEGCFDLEYLNVSGWSNEKFGNMSYMFHKVGNYKNGVEIILTDFKTPAVTTMAYMFTRDVTELETLDLSSFDTSNVTSMSSMFGGGSQGNGTFYNAKIKTVYVSDKFVTTKVDPESNVFNNTSVIVGGAGTTWSQKTADYARIDDPDNGEPGYFTIKGARYIRYHDNDGDDTNNEANSALMTSHYLTNTGSLKANAFANGSKTFIGWNTAADGSGDPYTDGQAMTELTESKTPLELYAQWEEASSGNEYEAMQSMTTAKCAEMEVGTMVNLQDTRDNKVYRVGKLADNNCWMLDTLKIANVEISDEDSDLPEDTTFVLPDSNNDAFEAATKNTPKLYIDPINNHGVFYSYYTATAGWGVYGNDNLAATTTDSPQSICPKGWKLPNGGNSYDGDFNNLVSVYGRDPTAYMGEFPGFELDGALYSSNGKVAGPADYGHNGYFWSSTNRSKWFANRFLIVDDVQSPESSGIFYDFNYYKYWENNIVCIAR
ncbi:BspA family leucine-rich repeat surface protein, partial [Candidatus Saccharibacteria bacterium]|nr:BspA family leucine-rich repeat surface protein [Candidatus Saccharibacteria bacterium]